MIKLFFWGLIFYLLYKVVFELVLPISKVASQMKKTVDQMQEQQQHVDATKNTVSPKQNTTNTNEEYIDFEEVK